MPISLPTTSHSLHTPPALYPFKGIYFCLTHPFTYPLFSARLVPLTLLSLLVYAFLFTTAYLPQVAFLAIFGHGPGAFFNAAILVLGEGAVLIQLLFEAFLADGSMANVFDAVLLHGKCDDLVLTQREIHPNPNDTSQNPVQRLGTFTASKIYSPFSLRQILEFILFLPLNLIPYIGTLLFLLITGARAGPLAHYRYFKMRGLRARERDIEVKGRRWGYVGFGTVQLALQLVPGAAMAFLLTSAAGSALWVVEIERGRRGVEEGNGDGEGRGGEEVYEEDAPPPAYSDEV